MEIKTIAILGGGRLGQAMKSLLEKKGVAVAVWDADESRFPGQKPLAEIVPPADAVLFCVPSPFMRNALATAAPLLKPAPEAVVVSFAKGMDASSQKTMPELFAELAPAHPLVAVGGPMLAEEISSGSNAAGAVAAKDPAVRGAFAALFAGPQFNAEPSDDPQSVAVAGILKNIYAVLLGIADGLKVGDNEKGWLTSQAAGEMASLAPFFGADPKLVMGTAGLGDLIATGYSEHSRNRKAGDEIVATGTCSLPGEGLLSLPSFLLRLTASGADLPAFPLLGTIKAICMDHRPAKETIDAYFTQETTGISSK